MPQKNKICISYWLVATDVKALEAFHKKCQRQYVPYTMAKAQHNGKVITCTLMDSIQDLGRF